MIELIKQIGLTKKQWWLIALGALGWIATIVASGLGWNPFPVNWSFTNSGAFGDSFAPISALMALIAALGAVGAYKIQSSEIARIRAREEEFDKIAQSDRARAISRQELLDRQTQKQIFENTFFQLLKSHRDLVNGLDLTERETGRQHQGHDVFRLMIEKFKEILNGDRTVKNVARVWESFSEHFRYDINHYFRMMYHIVKYIDNSEIEDKYLYIQILRASLSEGEIALLALSCDYGEGRQKFKVLVEKYALLHNLSEHEIRFWKLRSKYSKSAFSRDMGSTDFNEYNSGGGFGS
ncbi:putative phage abortive infection protein [uncultured Erythrobacter sp.]|uniref:putative phage abortive infection protein n=1 Tax=uncultured Erythrobacter sp. TaxID=263913 RepID=UPI0026592E62|nr:putative phage abortive infection protein [uncultured Erythrobacter sp.]